MTVERPVVVARGLGRTYGALAAVDGVDVDLAAGEVVGLLGANGAGKTTTLRMLAGALAPTRGSVSIAGHDVIRDPVAARRHLGLLPERPPLPPDMGVREVLLYAARLHRRVDPHADVAVALARCRLDEVADRIVGRLSKGWRQRVGLAVALVHRPVVLLLDEPASGLDPVQRVELRGLVRDVAAGGTAVLFSTHVLADVEATCDRVVVLHGGKIVHDASLAADTAELRVTVGRLDGAVEVARAVPGVVAVALDGAVLVVRTERDVRAALARALVDHDLLSLTATTGLEARFVQLVRGEVA